MNWSIRYRLFVPLGLLLLGVAGISTWSAMSAARQAEERIARQVKSVTHTLAGASLSLTPKILEQMKGLSGADYLLVDADERRIATLPNTQFELPAELVNQPADESPAEELGLPIEIDGSRYRSRRLPQRTGGNLYILYPEASLNEAIRDAVRPWVVFGLFGGLIAVASMLFIGQRLVGRIRDLERRTRQIAAGDFSPMSLPKQHDELRDLSQSVNDMAAKLAELQETVQKTERLRLLGQLSGGLAHQLRNSVTGAKLAIQLHAEDCSQADQEALQVALRQLNLMEANLRRFMDLGKHDGRPQQRCSIVSLIDDAVSLLRPQAVHAGIQLRWQRPEREIEIDGDAGQLRDAILNIAGNSIEAAGPKGIVEIDATILPSPGLAEADRMEKQSAVIEISDTGPGPPAAIADRLFEPFVTGKPEGIGLGLAVARHAVEMHGGELSWRRKGLETVFRIVLPVPRE
jgi:signal transduction histidine kinase